MVSASHHVAPAPAVDCSTIVLNMVDCLSYVSSGSTVSKPEGTCFSGLKIVLKSKCLCKAFKNSAQFGVSLNVTKALALPSAYKIYAPSISNCGGGGVDTSWHRSCRGLYKSNSIFDFVSCGEYLINEGYVHKCQLGAVGCSAGCLLVGTASNMYPELFQAIILKVPFLDICNTLLDPSLPLTILDYEEFGNPQIRSQFQSILSYSPYDNVEDRFPAVLKLEKESGVLCDFHVIDVEVQGQYFTNQAVAPDHTLKFDRVGADIPIVRRHGRSFRTLTLIGSDGSQRHFIVQTSLTPNARSDERILHLFRVMNQMFDKHKESRRRHICIHTPIIIHVWSQVICAA